jgi:hypothetical protein
LNRSELFTRQGLSHGVTLPIEPARIFHLDQIGAAHRAMEMNAAGGKIVVMTERSATHDQSVSE